MSYAVTVLEHRNEQNGWDSHGGKLPHRPDGRLIIRGYKGDWVPVITLRLDHHLPDYDSSSEVPAIDKIKAAVREMRGCYGQWFEDSDIRRSRYCFAVNDIDGNVEYHLFSTEENYLTSMNWEDMEDIVIVDTMDNFLPIGTLKIDHSKIVLEPRIRHEFIKGPHTV